MKIRTCALLLFLALATNILTSTSTQAADAPLTLGMILPLSGEAAAIGDAIKNGAELAYSELAPEIKAKFKLIYEDDALLPKNAVTAFQSLKAKEKLIAISAVSSGIGHAIAPLAESSKIPFINIGASDSKIAKDRPFVFLHWITPEVQVQAIIKELQKRNLQQLGIIMASQEGYYAQVAAFKQLLPNSGITLVMEEEMTQTEKDFGSFIAKISRVKDLDVLFVALMPGQNAQFAKKLRQSGSKVQIVGGELFDNPDEQKAAGKALSAAFYATPAEAAGEFLESYKKRFSNSSLFAAANGYDTVKLVAEYFEKSLPGSLGSFLRNLKDFSGACGQYSYSEGGKFSLPAEIKTIP